MSYHSFERMLGYHHFRQCHMVDSVLAYTYVYIYIYMKMFSYVSSISVFKHRLIVTRLKSGAQSLGCPGNHLPRSRDDPSNGSHIPESTVIHLSGIAVAAATANARACHFRYALVARSRCQRLAKNSDNTSANFVYN